MGGLVSVTVATVVEGDFFLKDDTDEFILDDFTDFYELLLSFVREKGRFSIKLKSTFA
jgi:hypothetical protein